MPTQKRSRVVRLFCSCVVVACCVGVVESWRSLLAWRRTELAGRACDSYYVAAGLHVVQYALLCAQPEGTWPGSLYEVSAILGTRLCCPSEPNACYQLETVTPDKWQKPIVRTCSHHERVITREADPWWVRMLLVH